MSEPTIDDRQQVIADLQAARGELVRRGWCAGMRVNENGNVCARGAINTALIPGFDAMYLEAKRGDRDGVNTWARAERKSVRSQVALDELQRHLPDGHTFVELWNDEVEAGTYRPVRTAEDVLNLFDKALAELGGLA